MSAPEQRIRSPVSQPVVANPYRTWRAVANPYRAARHAQTRPNPYSAQAAQAAQAVEVAEVQAAPNPYRLNRRRPGPRLRRTIHQLMLVIPPRKPATGLWWLPYSRWVNADPEETADEYEQQLAVGEEVDFDVATLKLSHYLEKCDADRLDHAACVAEVVEHGMTSILGSDPEVWHQLGTEWDRLLPQIQALRASLAVDPGWLIDNLAGEVTLRAFEWATELGEKFSFTGEQLRRNGRSFLSDPGFKDALLDATVFDFAFMLDEGRALFAEISLLRQRSYFPHSPRQVLVFDRFGDRDEELDGSKGLVGRYVVERSEYWSNLTTFPSPKHGVVGWRIHYMRPLDCNGSAC